MERTPPIPVEVWEQIPPHVQAVLLVVLDRYETRIARLEAERVARSPVPHYLQTIQDQAHFSREVCAILLSLGEVCTLEQIVAESASFKKSLKFVS